MFLIIIESLTRIVLFDDIFESLVFPNQTQLNDMVAKLIPLQTFVSIYIDVLS